MAPIREKCLFRLLTFVPGGKPAVTARYFYTFRRTYRIYRAVTPIPGVQRVQIQQLVTVQAWDGDYMREWRVVLDSRMLGDVRHVANVGVRRHPATRRGHHIARIDGPLFTESSQ